MTEVYVGMWIYFFTLGAAFWFIIFLIGNIAGFLWSSRNDMTQALPLRWRIVNVAAQPVCEPLRDAHLDARFIRFAKALNDHLAQRVISFALAGQARVMEASAKAGQVSGGS
jgi:hypothetical protein